MATQSLLVPKSQKTEVLSLYIVTGMIKLRMVRFDYLGRSGWALNTIKVSSWCESHTGTERRWCYEERQRQCAVAEDRGSHQELQEARDGSVKPREGARPANTLAAALSTEFRLLASRTTKEHISVVLKPSASWQFSYSRHRKQTNTLPNSTAYGYCLSSLGDDKSHRKKRLCVLVSL